MLKKYENLKGIFDTFVFFKIEFMKNGINVLVIGNLGYVGPVLVDYLASDNKYSIWGYDIGYFYGNEITKNILLPEVFLECQYFGDVREFNYELLRGMDVVVYLAAISNDPMGYAFEKPTYDINFSSAIKIARESKRMGVEKFVFASSCSVYGSADDSPKDEDNPLNPITAYARSKIMAEEALKEVADENFLITCLRFATACGFSPRLRLDLVLNDFIASAYLHKKIEILSNGQPWRPLIHVRDMARAIEWAMLRNKNSGYFLVCNCGSDEWNYRILDLAEAVKKEIPGTEISVNKEAPADKRSYRVNFNRFRLLAPEYYPKVTLSQTIQELVENFDRFGFQLSSFRNSQFIRLNTLNQLIKDGFINEGLKKL
jgi:nucleoside-diphosphate-sugar epimerase